LNIGTADDVWLINSNQEICYRCSGEQDSKIASVLYGITCRVKVEDFPNFDPVEVNADETSSLVTNLVHSTSSGFWRVVRPRAADEPG